MSMASPDSFQIEILGFPEIPIDAAADQLASAFGIEVEHAAQLLETLPARAKSDATKEEAQRYLSALLKAGADVRLESGGKSKVYRAKALQSKRKEEFADRPVTKSAPVAVDSTQMGCPKCGLVQPISDSCGRCGIIIAKYLDRFGDSVSVEIVTEEREAGKYDAVNPFVYVPGADDGLFADSEPVFEPAKLMRMSSASGAAIAVPRVETAAYSSVPRQPVTGSYAFPGEAFHMATGAAAAEMRGSSDIGFWNKIGIAVMYCIGGKSYQWLLLFLSLGCICGVGLTVILPAPGIFPTIIGLFVGYIFFCGFLAAQWRFFALAFMDGVTGRDDEEASGVTDLEDFKSEFVLPGIMLSIMALILWSPFLYFVIDAFQSATMYGPAAVNETAIIVTALIPLIYWPMGMAFITTFGRITEIFIIHGVLWGMIVGGIEYVFIAALGVLAFMGVNYFIGLQGGAELYHFGLLFLVLGWVSGVQGYLLAKLLRRRPKMIKGIDATTTEVEDEEDEDLVASA